MQATVLTKGVFTFAPQSSFGEFFYTSILLFKGFPLFGFLISQFKNTPTPLCLSRDKIKGQSGKNVTVTPTKTLPKNRTALLLIFIDLFTYKLYFQNKNYIYKKKHNFFFFYKIGPLTKKIKKPHARSVCDETSIILLY